MWTWKTIGYNEEKIHSNNALLFIESILNSLSTTKHAYISFIYFFFEGVVRLLLSSSHNIKSAPIFYGFAPRPKTAAEPPRSLFAWPLCISFSVDINMTDVNRIDTDMHLHIWSMQAGHEELPGGFHGVTNNCCCFWLSATLTSAAKESQFTVRRTPRVFPDL